MATWMVHFMIADYFLDMLDVCPEKFVVGSVAPDCGYGVKDSFGEFMPPPEITHWSPSGKKRDCRHEDFFKTYLEKEYDDPSDYSFYLGYYIHLLTDIMWSRCIYLPTVLKYSKQFERDKSIIRTIKQDWNDWDFMYLSRNPRFRPYELLREAKEVKDYLPYYEEGQLRIQSRFIVDYYKEGLTKNHIHSEYDYIDPREVEEFVSCTCELISRILEKKHLKL